MDQRPLPLAERHVLESRERQQVVFGVHDGLGSESFDDSWLKTVQRGDLDAPIRTNG
jgi:hypothetical protein